MATRHVIGVGLGMVSEPTAIIVVEGQVFPRFQGRPIFINGRIAHQKGFMTPEGFVEEHPPIVFSVRHAERMGPGISYPAIVERVQDLAGKLEEPALALDATAVGWATVALFEKTGLRPTPILVTAGDAVTADRGYLKIPKKDLVSTAQTLLQGERLKIAREISLADLMLRELRGFRMTVPLGGDDRPAWREGPHDDLVLALSVGLWIAVDTIRVPPPMPVVLRMGRRYRGFNR
jgi:hypothetical protein